MEPPNYADSLCKQYYKQTFLLKNRILRRFKGASFNDKDADDVFNDTWHACFKKSEEELRAIQSFLAYFSKILRNKAADRLEANMKYYNREREQIAREPEHFDDIGENDSDSSRNKIDNNAIAFDSTWECEDFLNLLASKLNDKELKLLELLIDGCKREEIAQQLYQNTDKMTRVRVKTQICRLRQKIKSFRGGLLS
ncbi:MAG: sigma-70 family RNA polymerase sigma factor [Chitinophagales bacterium]|nr:sigma-70 family RNA polymerase sigma factor [Chitinophagales bacterium]